MEKRKILIVDDEEDFTMMVKLNLEKTGKYEVKTENNGTSALATAKEFKPDLILLDLLMPDMNGSVVAQQIEENEEVKKIPIVFLTAIEKKGETDLEGRTVDGHYFIVKPVNIEDLIACIEKNIRT